MTVVIKTELSAFAHIEEEQIHIAHVLLRATAYDATVGIAIKRCDGLGHWRQTRLGIGWTFVLETRLFSLGTQIEQTHKAIGGTHQQGVSSLVEKAHTTDGNILRRVAHKGHALLVNGCE